MAITYNSAGAIATGTSTVNIAHPASIAAGDLLVAILGGKPSAANSGGAQTPAGWSPLTTGVFGGGYGATLGADTGNTWIAAFYKVATGGESGSQSVSITNGNVTWGCMVRLSNASKAWSLAHATGEDTSAGSVSIAFGSNPGVTAGDYVLAGLCIPTDITTPSQFSAAALSQTGITFGAVSEIGEPDSTTGNDIGGLLVRAAVSSGTASAAPSLTATAGGTTTNVRGPGIFIRIREEVGGTGGLAAAAGAASGTGASEGSGTGALTCAVSAAAGDGAAQSAGSGSAPAGGAVVSGLGETGWTGTGTLTSGDAGADGSGSAGASGSGAIGAGAPTASGAATSASSGTGSGSAGTAGAAGSSVGASSGTGAATATSAAANGNGAGATAGSGAIVAVAPAIVGAGGNAIAGAGEMIAGSAAAAAAGDGGAGGGGAIATAGVSVAGAGASASSGSGTAVAGDGITAGAGESGASGTAALIAAASGLEGTDLVAIGIGSIAISSAAMGRVSVTAGGADAEAGNNQQGSAAHSEALATMQTAAQAVGGIKVGP